MFGLAAGLLLGVIWATSARAETSSCFGSTSNGRLENGVQLPASGANFQSYSTLGDMLGRTWVHSVVRDIVVQAYRELETGAPGKVFVYAETGSREGGRFKPHKTHQNGLSVDFMVPVLQDGHSVPLPTSPLNKFGYAIEFDDTGRFEDYRIDFEAIALHLTALRAQAKAQGVAIERVIFEVPLQAQLFATKAGESLRQQMKFSTKPAWVRHDEHYHVDFAVPCKPMHAPRAR